MRIENSAHLGSRSKIYGAWGHLIPYLWPAGKAGIRTRVVVAMVCLVLSKVATVSIPLIYGAMVDLVVNSSGFEWIALISIVGAYAVVRLGQQFFEELRQYVFVRVAQRTIRETALKTFRHLHALSLRFHLDRQTGGLARIIERGTKGIEFLLSFLLFSTLPTILEVCAVAVIFWWLFDWLLAVITIVTVGCYVLYTFTVTEWWIKFHRKMNQADQHAGAKMVDSLLNYETVKHFCSEEVEAQNYNKALREYENAAVRHRRSRSLLNIGQGVIITVGISAIMLYAGGEIKSGQMSTGDFVAINAYLLQLYLPLNFLGTVYREIRQSLTNMEAMFTLLNEPIEITDPPNHSPLKVDRGEISFENVSFNYDGRKVLDNISFRVPTGRKVAIVGPSGSGKSTIVRLLMRFYDVTSGVIKIDDKDIRSVTQESLRSAIGSVPQEVVLFNDTIGQNIGYGHPKASSEEISEVAKLASIHDFINSLPNKYDTMVGERGLKLSGGEKQRVAIARALLKKSKIFVFDEATSSLDSRTEKEIQNSLNRVATAKTTLAIAHRLSTIVDAEEILVLSEGRIEERGTHAELLARDGLYAVMWQRQLKNRELV